MSFRAIWPPDTGDAVVSPEHRPGAGSRVPLELVEVAQRRSPGRIRARSARSSSSEISPMARLTPRYGRFRSSWYTTVEIRGLISITCSPTSWMLKKCSIPSSATIAFASSISAGSSSVSKYIASPARIASRVFAWPSTTSRPFAMPSTVRSGPFAAPSRAAPSGRRPRRGSRPRPRAASTPSPGRSRSSWSARSTVGRGCGSRASPTRTPA